MSHPAVSVVLPFRNADSFLSEALVSIAGQTFQEFEVILVNDNSDDTSPAIAKDCCRQDPRFCLIHSSGRGLVDALNSGLARSRGDWIARMDADDISLPERLEKQLNLALSAGPETVISCQVESFPDDVVTNGYRMYESWLNHLIEPEDIKKNLFVESPVPHPTAFFHREGILAAGGYLERELPEDYELWLRLWNRGFRFSRVPEVLLRWRDHPDRFSRNSSSYSMTSFYRLKAKYLAYVPCMSAKRVLIAGSGQTARRLGKCLQDEGFEIKAFIDPDTDRQGQTLRNRPVTGTAILSEFPDIPAVIATRIPGAGDAAREFLKDLGRIEWKDFVVCS
ncbi:MAG: glycosyltransferase [Candidatus Aegiribacteria sp.]|nr:glycosyltransferase [Candidatus Aegiribacteria sp.]